jgi:hypothetical protein
MVSWTPSVIQTNYVLHECDTEMMVKMGEIKLTMIGWLRMGLDFEAQSRIIATLQSHMKLRSTCPLDMRECTKFSLSNRCTTYSYLDWYRVIFISGFWSPCWPKSQIPDMALIYICKICYVVTLVFYEFCISFIFIIVLWITAEADIFLLCWCCQDQWSSCLLELETSVALCA